MATNLTHPFRAGRNQIAATTDLDPLVQSSRINDVRTTSVEFVEEGGWHPFIITNATKIDAEIYQWRYEATKAYAVGPTEGGGSQEAGQWEQMHEWVFILYNGREILNTTDSTYYGNGVLRSDLPDGFELSPIPIGSPVMAMYFSFPGGGEWRFFEPNGITGTCESGSGS